MKKFFSLVWCLSVFFWVALLPIFAADNYKISNEDVLLITVYDEPDLTIKARVDSRGEISFSLLGNVSVIDLTVQQLKEKLETLLKKDYLVDPRVHVFIEEYHPRQVFVTGAVEKPGAYDLPRDKKTTFIEVISLAGGFKKSAALNKCRVMRKTKTGDPVVHVKAGAIVKGKKEENVEIKPNDVIFVPDSFF
ncbi:polysaccharide biosynthesis/export family protein [Candidatus Auribacterota bacterium]